MKTLYRTLLVTTAILTIYVVFLLEKSIPDVKQSVMDSQKNLVELQTQFSKQQEILTALQIELAAFHKETNERIAKEQKRKDTLNSVKLALSKVEEADAMRKTGNLAKAIETLLSAKKPLWEAGEVFQSEQTAFRGFMNPIDAIIGQWKSDNAMADTTQLAATIKATLDKLSRGL